jgi:hypothetical protein
MASFTVVYDACVLYPARVRDFLIRLACTNLVRARWTKDIHEEWITNLLQRRQDLSRDQLEYTRHLMDDAVLDCLVEGYASLVPALQLPDPDDRHVLAAAIRCNAQAIITYNLKDFPAEQLEPFGIEAQHPDVFAMHLYDLNPGAVIGAARSQRQALLNPPESVEEFLQGLLDAGFTETVSQLRGVQELL